MKTKHTPGPWRFNKNKTALLALNKNNEYVFIYNASPYNSMEPSSKDAALIAAAPEMLEVLQLVGTIANISIELSDADYKNRMNRISELATNIINKAKGE